MKISYRGCVCRHMYYDVCQEGNKGACKLALCVVAAKHVARPPLERAASRRQLRRQRRVEVAADNGGLVQQQCRCMSATAHSRSHRAGARTARVSWSWAASWSWSSVAAAWSGSRSRTSRTQCTCPQCTLQAAHGESSAA